MTLTAGATRAEQDQGPAERPSRLALAEHVSVVTALLWWLFPLTHAAGGRDAWSLTLATVPAVIALLCVRPWERLSRGALVLGAAVAAAPVAVCLLTPPGWFGAVQAATYGYSAVLFLAVRAYCSSAARRLTVIGLVLAGGVAQVAWSLIPWIGGGDPQAVISGTFYWYNQYAAFLLAPALIGAGLAAVGHGSLRLAGAVGAALASAGVVLSTSRASLALLVAGWLAVGVVGVAAQADHRRRFLSAARWSATAAAAAVVTTALPGPPFFAHRVSALAATAARNSQESVGQNGGYRLQFWKQAIVVFRHHTLAGAGFGSFGTEAGRLDPHLAHSALVHSGLLQPLSDGGIVLALPFWSACAVVGWGLIRRLLPSVWRREHGIVSVVAVAALATTAHSAVDFDWTYPSLMALTAVLAAVALSSSAFATDIGEARRPPYLPVIVLVAATVLLAVAGRGGGWRLTAPVHVPAPATAGASLR